MRLQAAAARPAQRLRIIVANRRKQVVAPRAVAVLIVFMI
jgi:septum formation topological specificity factor MinE